jgi:hypothetical protein
MDGALAGSEAGGIDEALAGGGTSGMAEAAGAIGASADELSAGVTGTCEGTLVDEVAWTGGGESLAGAFASNGFRSVPLMKYSRMAPFSSRGTG